MKERGEVALRESLWTIPLIVLILSSYPLLLIFIRDKHNQSDRDWLAPSYNHLSD